MQHCDDVTHMMILSASPPDDRFQDNHWLLFLLYPRWSGTRRFPFLNPGGYPQIGGEFGVRGRLIAKLETLPARYVHNLRIFSRFSAGSTLRQFQGEEEP